MRKAIESLYQDICNIYIFEKVVSELTGTTKFEKKITSENIPCRLSFKNISSVNQTTGKGIVAQSVKLFLSPDVKILNNSEIEVIRNGKSIIYECSGQPALYNNHQEVMLKLKDEES